MVDTSNPKISSLAFPGEVLPVYKYMPNKPHNTSAMHTGMRERYRCSCQGFKLPVDGEVPVTPCAILHQSYKTQRRHCCVP